MLDIIESESLANPALDKECLEKQLEGFSDEDLANIADEEGAAQLAEFKAALSSCLGSS